MSNPALKLDVFIAHPSYGGNGGISSEHPNIREWEVQTILKMKSDDRIGEIHMHTIADTPITMVRNQFVQMARAAGSHLLLMIDSDQNPLLYKDNPSQKPFWDVAFTECYNHYSKGPLVIGAPYCGAPPHENVFVFQFDNRMVIGDETPIMLEQYTRAQASVMTGVQECAALPTGMILYDMRAFDLIEPSDRSMDEILDDVASGEISRGEAKRDLSRGWFYYDWKDCTASQKASTEDVTNTRDISMAGAVKLGYNPLRCAWDCWVGHWKPWCVGKPALYSVDDIGQNFRRAMYRDTSRNDNLHDVQQDDVLALLEQKEQLVPTEVAALVPHAVLPSVEMRDVYGNQLVTVGHRTPDAHLKGLHDLIGSVPAASSGAQVRVTEVGSWLGESAVAMLSAGNVLIRCVDDWVTGPHGDTKFNPKPVFNYNVMGFSGQVIPHTGKSLDVAKESRLWTKQDIVFIDANHTYEDVRDDILAWLPCLADNGVMIGHDYMTDQFPGVTEAVGEIFGEHVRPYCTDSGGGFWMVMMNDIDREGILKGEEILT